MKERKLGALGKKVGMTTVFSGDGRAMGVTVLEVGPCLVVARRTQQRDGYCALVLGFGPRRANKLNRPQLGALAPVGGAEAARRWLCEMRVSEETAARFAPGASVGLADLGIAPGSQVDVRGRSIGKGFQGVMKRHNFAGFRASHGTHEYFRHGGSIGCRKWPGRVFKGRKMPGQMGNAMVSVQNLEVVEVRPDDNALLVLGAVPGKANADITVRPAIKRHPLP